MIPVPAFPLLTSDNHRVTSPANPRYNCIAWVAGDSTSWWEPGLHWPTTLASDPGSMEVLTQVFVSLGYQECGPDAGLESGFEKVALYGSAAEYMHAARQLAHGPWTSKLGKDVDIEHDYLTMSPAASTAT